MHLKPEIIEKIKENYKLQSALIDVSEKSPRTVYDWISKNNEMLTLARFLFPISAWLETPIEDLIDIS